MSVQLAPNRFHHGQPRLRQAVKLLGFDRMIERDPLEQRDLFCHQAQVGNGPLPRPGHFTIAVQGLAALDDALVGFGWGHRLEHATALGPVNGRGP